MHKIIIKHSRIEINNYKLGDCKSLENSFSVYDRITHTQFFKAIEYDEDNMKLILPRGIDIYYLEKLFKTNAYLDTKHDEFDTLNTQTKIKYAPRDDVQKEALKFMLGESIQYRYTKSKSQISLNLPTGKGKTYCSIYTASYFNIRSILITSSIGWLNQWKDAIVEYTDIKSREIYMISGTASIHRLLNRDISQYKFILASHNTIKSYGDTYGWNKVNELFKYMRVGLKFYDEAHLNFDNMCKIDFHSNTFKTYYITATPYRSDSDENRIFQLAFKNVPSINLFDENTDPHTKYIAIRFRSEPTPMEVSDCKGAYGLDRNKYVNYLTKKPNYYNMIHLILHLIMKTNGKSLIYIGTNKAIEITKIWIEQNYPELIGHIGVYTSVVKENKHEQLNKMIILSTTKSCGAAVDIKGLKNTFVLAEPFKSEVTATQTIGRTRDNNTFYFDIVDDSFPQTRKYYTVKKPIFSKYAESCTEIKISSDELNMKVINILNNRYKKYTNVLYRFEKIYNPIYRIKTNNTFNPIIRIR